MSQVSRYPSAVFEVRDGWDIRGAWDSVNAGCYGAVGVEGTETEDDVPSWTQMPVSFTPQLEMGILETLMAQGFEGVFFSVILSFSGIVMYGIMCYNRSINPPFGEGA
jgi:hypothetical protein